ncbi:MAG: hypothetical protein ACREPM_01340 [Gemmatimonadaceae bacterium]
MLIGDVLYPVAARRNTGSIIGWWESRRLTFNLIVGGAGLLTLGALRLIFWLPPQMPMPFLGQPIILFGVMANVCYTFGWMLEASAQRFWGDRVRPIGPALFRQGIAFSVGLTLLPIVVGAATWVIRFAVAIFR